MMQEPRFTKGPWLFEEGQPRITKHWYDDKFVTIAIVTPPEFHENHVCGGREAGANGHLIAAAPDLYEALEAESALIVSAQELIASYLPPDGISKDALINGLIELFDGHRQRAAQSKSDAAFAKARSEA